MKKFLRPVSVLFLCGFLFNSALAQQSITDSLQMLVKKDKEDTSKVNHLNMLGRKVMYSNPDTTIILCNQALALAKKLEWKRGISNSLANIGYSYSLLGNYSKALECNFNALKIAEVLNDKNNLANCLGNIGLVYYHKGDYLKALDYYFKALKIAEEFGDKNAITRHLCNIGIVYYLQEDFPK
jgi:tetratricopeptide (TPR) repeat protein